MEFALVLTVFVLLVFGIVEFSRAYNAKVTLTHATREGVRVLAVTQDSGSAVTATVNAATSLDPALLSVSTTACVPGDPTSVAATYPFTYNIPLFGSATVTLKSEGVMRCGG
ncbi:MAG: TadE/TadG family type IV pilus assembly protein [Acidimicrobiia bacterium]